jgi:hypothetical protein
VVDPPERNFLCFAANLVEQPGENMERVRLHGPKIPDRPGISEKKRNRLCTQGVMYESNVYVLRNPSKKVRSRDVAAYALAQIKKQYDAKSPAERFALAMYGKMMKHMEQSEFFLRHEQGSGIDVVEVRMSCDIKRRKQNPYFYDLEKGFQTWVPFKAERPN